MQGAGVESPASGESGGRWLDPSDFERIYGPQLSFTPEEARELLSGLEAPWWVAGGWAIEAFTGVSRQHEDIDLAVFRRDVDALRRHLEGDWHLWAASEQGLLYLAPDRLMPEHSEQVWVREHALAPWRAELVLSPDADGRWQFKRDPSVVLPLEQAVWVRDGVRYLRPELVLAHKVRTARPKDDADLAGSATAARRDGARLARDVRPPRGSHAPVAGAALILRCGRQRGGAPARRPSPES